VQHFRQRNPGIRVCTNSFMTLRWCNKFHTTQITLMTRARREEPSGLRGSRRARCSATISYAPSFVPEFRSNLEPDSRFDLWVYLGSERAILVRDHVAFLLRTERCSSGFTSGEMQNSGVPRTSPPGHFVRHKVLPPPIRPTHRFVRRRTILTSLWSTRCSCHTITLKHNSTNAFSSSSMSKNFKAPRSLGCNRLAIWILSAGCISCLTPRPTLASSQRNLSFEHRSMYIRQISPKGLAIVVDAAGRHAWAWHDGTSEIFSLTLDGHLTPITDRAFAGLRATGIYPVGNTAYAILRAMSFGAYLIGSDTNSPVRQLLSNSWNLVDVIPSKNGLWLETTNMQDRSGARYMFFVSNQALALSGPWKLARDAYRAVALPNSDTLVMASALNSLSWNPLSRSYTVSSQASLEVDLVDPSRGILSSSVPVQVRSGGFWLPRIVLASSNAVWICSTQFNGVLFLDAQTALSQRSISSSTYRMLGFGYPIIVRPVSGGSLFVFPENFGKAQHELGGYVVSEDEHTRSATDNPLAQLSHSIVEEAVPLPGGAMLVQATSQGQPHRVYVWHHGQPLQAVRTTMPLNQSSPEFGDLLLPWQVLPLSAKGDFLLLLTFGSRLFFFSSITDRLKLLSFGGERIKLVPGGQGGVWVTDPNLQSKLFGVSRVAVASDSLIDSVPLFVNAPDFPTLTQIPGSQSIFASSERVGTYLINPTAASVPVTVWLGNQAFSPSTPASPTTTSFDPNERYPNAFGLVGNSSTEDLVRGARIAADINCPKSVPVSLSAQPAISGGRVQLFRQSAGRMSLSHACAVTIQYTDAFGSDVSRTWTGIRFNPPQNVLEKVWFHSLIVYFVILVIAYIALHLRGGLQRWLPALSYLGGGLAVSVLASPAFIDRWLVAAALTITVVVATAFGALSGSVFRAIVVTEPYRSAAPLILLIRPVRRRVFDAYVGRLREQLKAVREERAISEVYVDLSVKVLSGNGTSRGSIATSDILRGLCTIKKEDRCTVLVEAPGGRGKSALLRRIVELSLNAYDRDPASPLPILCHGIDGDVSTRIRLALAADGFPDEVLDALFRAGDFFLVFDGLTESNLTSGQLLGHVALYGSSAPLLLAARPGSSFRDAMANLPRWIVIEPGRLDEVNLEEFLRCYGCESNDFPESARAACRNREGEYLPILVRLAILHVGQSLRSIADVYRIAVAQLLKSDDALIDEAAELCYRTYWVTAKRTLAFSTAEAGQKAVIRRLLAAGLVIIPPGQWSHDHDPLAVRFFHDSIQTYLTAVFLSRDRDTWTDHLIEAAGDSRFSRDRSDLIISNGRELYEMCLLAGGQRDEVLPLLVDQLRAFVAAYPGQFSRDWVTEIPELPESLHDIESWRSGAYTVSAAVDACCVADNFAGLAALFARSAMLLWPRIKVPKLKPTPAEIAY
jgi:hypothetical protein